MPEELLPWARVFRRRCIAQLDKDTSPDYHGRCELERGHPGESHALERGRIVVRWVVFTKWEGP